MVVDLNDPDKIQAVLPGGVTSTTLIQKLLHGDGAA
jgi:hypothetical protein